MTKSCLNLEFYDNEIIAQRIRCTTYVLPEFANMVYTAKYVQSESISMATKLLHNISVAQYICCQITRI